MTQDQPKKLTVAADASTESLADKAQRLRLLAVGAAQQSLREYREALNVLRAKADEVRRLSEASLLAPTHGDRAGRVVDACRAELQHLEAMEGRNVR